MSLIFIEGFDGFSSTVPVSSTYTSSSVTLLTGTNTRWNYGTCVSIAGANSVSLSLPANISTLTLGFAAYFLGGGGVGNAFNFVEWLDGSGSFVLAAHYITSNAIEIARSTSTGSNVVGTTAPGVITTAVWCYIEISITRHASAGTVQISINGSTVLSLTGVNTGSADFGQLKLIGPNNPMRIDDVYIKDDLSQLGDCRVQVLVPSADSSVQWTPLTGVFNYLMVSEMASDGDTTYIYTSTAGNSDTYDLTNLGVTPTSIFGVAISMFARKDDPGVRTIRGDLVSGSTTSNGLSNNLSSTYSSYGQTAISGVGVWSTDPNTGSAWTISALDALQVKIDCIA